MSFDATLGGRDQTSYVSVAQADSYCEDDRTGTTKWAAQSDAVKQKCLMQATAYIDKLHFEGQRLWPGHQRLQWPRYQAFTPSLRDDVQGVEQPDYGNPLVLLRFSGTAASGSTTTIVNTALTDDLQNYPDDIWNEGSVRIESGTDGNQYVVRAVTDFVASTGTLKVTAFPATVATGTSFTVVEPVPPTLIEATCELALRILNDDSGYVDSEDTRTLLTETVKRILGKVLRRTFSAV